jgi:DNA recombination protein RmuC
VLERANSELRAELARTQHALHAAEARAETLLDVQRALELAQRELKAMAEEKARLEARSDLVAGLQETAARQQAHLDQLRSALGHAESENASLAARIQGFAANAEERQALVEVARTTLSDVFKARSAEALESNRQMFLDLARATFDEAQRRVGTEMDTRQRAIEGRLGVMHEKLERLQETVRDFESSRHEGQVALRDDLEALRNAQETLRVAAAQLGQAARPLGTGNRVSVVPLRRLVQVAGLADRCRLEEHVSPAGEDGEQRRDVLIRLPGGRTTLIDCSVPLAAYFASLHLDEGADRRELLRSHAIEMRRHVERLAGRAHAEPFLSSDGLVIMYVPVEDALAAALDEDHELISHAVGSSVIPVGPLTLLTHLRTIAWTAEAVERHPHGEA